MACGEELPFIQIPLVVLGFVQFPVKVPIDPFPLVLTLFLSVTLFINLVPGFYMYLFQKMPIALTI